MTRDPSHLPRAPWLDRAIDAWTDLATRDPWMRARYGPTGDRCPIVRTPTGGHVCLFHVRPVADATATRCDAR